MNPKTKIADKEVVSPEKRRQHKPVSGALYRCKQNGNGSGYKIKKDDIVMVVSECPHLVDKIFIFTKGTQEVETVIQRWVDLAILWDEKIISMDGSRESLWYYWFERIEYEQKT